MIAMPGFIRSLALLTIACSSAACQAIDNPDAPNYLENFRTEASSYEKAIYQDAQTTLEATEEYRRYIEFLEKELAAAETALKGELAESDRARFTEAQTAWEDYQKAEEAFVSGVWTPTNFGSSSAFSRLEYYADILRSRTELLLKYRMQF